jgi:S1-C subfamily serine protease
MKGFAVSLLLMVFPSYILSQTTTPKNTIAKPELIQRGVVVEEVAKHSAAEKAGLREDDVLLAWHRADATGNVESPFYIAATRE